ncbi:MAG: zinc metallopeptidase [Clostridia bacterium]|nr:zinc metallopeptidase [Clostridia bacterium]
MLFYYGLDYYYLVLVLPAILLMTIAQISVKTTFSKYSQKLCHITGAEAARRVLNANGVSGVRIERVSGNLTDHFDPKTNVIRLSDAVYDSNSVAAAGVAAHEAGHAVQYALNYTPIKIRGAIYPICNIGSRLAIPLVMFGFLFSFYYLIDLGIIFFALALLFQLVTLPVEFNASRRAISALSGFGILANEDEVKGAKKVLFAAAMTYVTSFLVSLAQLLRLLALANRRRR